MTYYTVSRPTTTPYTVTVDASIWYTSSIVAIRTWLSLANQGLKTWAKLKELGLTTWKKLGAARGGGAVTFYYITADPTTTAYAVLNPTTTCYEVSV
jgi:hypothetical protein